MKREYLIGTYEVFANQHKPVQHALKIQALLDEGTLAVILAEGMGESDLEVKLSVRKDEIWPQNGGFDRSEKYAIFVETEDGLAESAGLLREV